LWRIYIQTTGNLSVVAHPYLFVVAHPDSVYWRALQTKRPRERILKLEFQMEIVERKLIWELFTGK
jgi:hypothetical protein